jgi:hypothetical protein
MSVPIGVIPISSCVRPHATSSTAHFRKRRPRLPKRADPACNARGCILVAAKLDAGQQEMTLIVEGIWPAEAFAEKRAINTLIGDDPVPPNGGAGFHDTAVWLERA